MGSFSGLGIGLSFVFGCILMGLVAELYYLLWWKKRIANSSSSSREIEEFSFLFCWRKPSSFHSTSSSNQELTNSVRNSDEQEDLEPGSNKNNLGLKECSEEGVEAELMRLHNLCGPPRFLFTIKEESKEDLESDDGKSRKGSRTRSLSDLVFANVDGTPFITPLSSPTLKNPNSLDSYNHHGINPLFESISEAELNRLRSSPPPKFKFMRDAEDKLLRKLLREEADRKMNSKVEESVQESVTNSKIEGKSVGFVSVINVREQLHNQATQVLPLVSSPTFQQSG